MAYLEITAGQVDADSPLDATLFGQIRDNQIYFKAEKLERDGSISLTGTLDANGQSIIMGGGLFDTEGGDINAGGGNYDAEGGNIVCEDMTVNGVLTADLLATSNVNLSMKGTQETAAAAVLKDTTNTLDFLSHLTDSKHFVWVPDWLLYTCPFVNAVTDVDNLALLDSSNSGAGAPAALGNGNEYLIIDLPDESDLLLIYTNSTTASPQTISISDEHGGLKRSWIFCKFSQVSGTPRTSTATYGGELINPTLLSGANPTNEWFCFRIKPGTNDLVWTLQASTTTSDIEIWVEHGLDPVQAGI